MGGNLSDISIAINSDTNTMVLAPAWQILVHHNAGASWECSWFSWVHLRAPWHWDYNVSDPQKYSLWCFLFYHIGQCSMTLFPCPSWQRRDHEEQVQHNDRASWSRACWWGPLWWFWVWKGSWGNVSTSNCVSFNIVCALRSVMDFTNMYHLSIIIILIKLYDDFTILRNAWPRKHASKKLKLKMLHLERKLRRLHLLEEKAGARLHFSKWLARYCCDNVDYVMKMYLLTFDLDFLFLVDAG